MGRKTCTSEDRFWTASVAAEYARVSETFVKRSMIEGTLKCADVFRNSRDLRTTQEWVDEWLLSLYSLKSPVQQAKNILNNQRA